MEGAWEIPLPGAQTPTPTAIHAHCLLLYFVQLVGPGCRFFRPACPALLLINHLSTTCYSPCGQSVPPASQDRTQAHAHDETESAIGNAAQHRFGVRMRYRRKIQRKQDMTIPGRGLVRTSDCRCPLLFTRTACCFILYSFCIPPRASNLLFECVLDCGESYRANISGLRVEVRPAMSLSAHATAIRQGGAGSPRAGPHPAAAAPTAASAHRRR